jgi:uracil-DNA glycosylase
MQNSIFKDIISPCWYEIFEEIDPDVFEITENEYKKVKDNTNVFPCFKNIFNFTKFCSPEDVKVILLGQDPYPGLFCNQLDKNYYPQATGLAFSVPKQSPIPASLVNIYDNMKRFGHQIFKPEHGNLEYWAYQGVLMLNTSLTVEKSKPNSHQKIWSMFTDELIEVFTKKYTDLIIVLWGGSALNKMNIIKNKDKQEFVISSHPSPLGFKNMLKTSPSFYEGDHFGKINSILKNKNKKEIDWQIYN